MSRHVRLARATTIALAAVIASTSGDWMGPTPAAAEEPTAQTSPPPDVPADPPAPARRGVELVEKRTATSDTFDNGDGSFTTTLYSEPVYYEAPGKASFERIDVGFASAGGNDRALTSSRAPAVVGIAPATDERGFVWLSSGGHTISLRPLPGAPLSPAADQAPGADGAAADLAEVLPGVGLRVLARADGAHNFFILDQPADAAALSFVISAPDLSLKRDAVGAWLFVDDAGTEVARMPQPYALDSTPDTTHHGGGRLTMSVDLAIEGLGPQWLATLSVDPAWLADAVYPVYVDPTLIFSTTAQVADSHVSSGHPTINYASYCRPDSPYYCELWLGQDPSGLSGEDRDYILFSVAGSDIENKTIDTATFKILPYHQYYNAPTPLTTWIDRVDSSWTEANITWNNKPANHTAIGSFTTVEGSFAAYSSANLLSTVRGWANGTITNYGIRLWCNGCGTTNWKRFISSEQGGSYTPRLVVDYHTPTASVDEPTGWTADKTFVWIYSDQSSHVQSDYHVDVASDSGFTNIVSSSGDAPGAATTWTSTYAFLNGTAYWWRVRVKDGTSWSPWASTSFSYDAALPDIDAFTQPAADPTFVGAAPSTWNVAWPLVTAPSGISALTLYEERSTTAVTTPGTCSDLAYTANTSWALATNATSKSVTASGHTNGYCYHYYLWAQSGTLGTTTGPDSNPILYDTSAPTIAFTNPLTGTTLTAIPPTAAWTETDTAAGIQGRTLTQQWASVTSPGTCSTTWNTGPVSTAPSPVHQGTLVGTCYRWTLGATDQAGNAASVITSGILIRDSATNLGQQRQHTFESWDLGSGDSAAVNVATGNLVLTHPIVALPIRGSSVGLELTYNRQDAANVGMGPGWRLNVFRRLTINADNSVTFVDADGARYTFTTPVVNGTITTYTRPLNLYANLVKDTSLAFEFTLTYRDQAKDKFDILGSDAILVRAEDRFTNGTTFTYTPGTSRISQIQDTAGGRNIDLAWDGSNRLSSITDWAWIDGSGVVQTSATGSRRTYRFFYDASSNLIGWSDPLNTTGSCPTGGSHLTCLSYPTDEVDVSKTQTVTTTGATSLGTTTRAITTKVTFAGSDVATVKDAEQVFVGGPATTFGWVSPTRVDVSRPTTSADYGLVGQNDPYARIASAWKTLALEEGGSVDIERRTTWDTSYPSEPASITENYGAQLGTPARTTSYTYFASTLGLVDKVTEPLTATDSRWTQYVYNANNDVTQKTVSLNGSATKTVTRYCYSTQSMTCTTDETGVGTIRRQIDNWVSAGPQDDDENVATDFTYDAYGRRTVVTRHNRDVTGAVRDDRVDSVVYDATNLGNLVTEIRNYDTGSVTYPGTDTTPGSDSVRTDLTTSHTYDTAGNRVSTADPRRAIGNAIPSSQPYEFTPTDDAYVWSNDPGVNYGSQTNLAVSGPVLGNESYLSFDVTGLVGTVTAATLRIENSATSTITPALRVIGAAVSGTSAITPSPAAGHVSGDVELLFVETANEAASLTTAAGFALIPGTGVGTGTAGGSASSRLTVFWRRWNGSDGSPTIADSGNHQQARIASYRNVVSSGTPWDVVGSNQQATATTAGSASGITTTVANTLVVIATSGALPDANGSTEFSSWSNGGLTSLTERGDSTVNDGNGGSLGLADGVRTSTGATGATTFTTASSATKDSVVIALKNPRSICVHRVTDTTWNEGTVTWVTKPAADPAAISCVVGNQAAGPIDYPLGTNVPGPGIWSFQVTSDHSSLVSYASKEHATLADPKLLLTVSYGPLGVDDYVTRWTYSALNERLTEKTPSTYGIDPTCPPPPANQACRFSTSTYDELGAVRLAVDFGGVTTGTEFDRAGRATTTFEDPFLSGAGLDPATTSTATYDPDGRVDHARDRNQVGSAADDYTDNDYDSLGRTIGVTEAANTADESLTQMTYDALDRRLTLVVAGQDTAYGYDLGGRTLSTDDDFTCESQTYDYRDLAQAVTSGLDGGTCGISQQTHWRTVTNAYDGLGRLRTVTVTNTWDDVGEGDRTTEDVLDSAGNRLSAAKYVAATQTTTTTSFTVTKLDATIAESRPDGSTAKSTFDPAGNAADRCYWKPGLSVGDCLIVGAIGWQNPPSQSTSTTFDARNSKVQQVDGLTNQKTTYDPLHNYQPRESYLPTGSGRELQSLSGYDSRHRLISVTHQLCVVSNVVTHSCSSTTAAGSDTYTYDDNDNRTRVNEANGATTLDRYYCYDGRNQLVSVGGTTCTSGTPESYTYDPAGNRLTAPGRTFTYTGDGQLTSCTGPTCSISYDSAGRTATWTENGVAWSYLYDSEGRLTSACKASSCLGSGFDRIDMTYDGEGHRTQVVETPATPTQQIPVVTRTFRYQGSAVVEESAASVNGTVVRTFVVDDAGAPVKVCLPDCATATYLPTWNGHGDLLALWRQNADGTLTLANSVTYDTWGKPSNVLGHNGYTDLGVRLLYVGRSDVWWDNAFGAGLLYMHARHYSPTLGRFLQPDPSNEEQNPYVYAANSCMTFADPAGTAYRRPDTGKCKELKEELMRAVYEVVRRAWENRIGRIDDPFDHATSYREAQEHLRSLLGPFNSGGCPKKVGYPKPYTVKWSQHEMPPPRGASQTATVSIDGKSIVVVIAGVGAAAVAAKLVGGSGAGGGGFMFMAYRRTGVTMLLR